MPLLTPSHHPPRPVTTGHGKHEQEIGDEADVKAQVVEEVGRARLCNNQINSGAEKAVVRKLDRRILTLLVMLCSFPSSIHYLPINLNYPRPDLLSTLDRSNIGYKSCCDIDRAETENAYC